MGTCGNEELLNIQQLLKDMLNLSFRILGDGQK